MEKQSILMVCLGNICRSPLAEGIMLHLIEERGLTDQFDVDSAGTGSYHVGERPHPEGRQIAAHHGITLRGRSRQLTRADLDQFDWLVAMDTSNRNGIRHLDEYGKYDHKIVMLLDYARGDAPKDVPDPYYVGGFDIVYKLVLDACEGFLDHILAQK